MCASRIADTAFDGEQSFAVRLDERHDLCPGGELDVLFLHSVSKYAGQRQCWRGCVALFQPLSKAGGAVMLRSCKLITRCKSGRRMASSSPTPCRWTSPVPARRRRRREKRWTKPCGCS